jgi:hypothetical protein
MKEIGALGALDKLLELYLYLFGVASCSREV